MAAATLLLPSVALAHGGGVDANGCHTNKKTGDYHCHGGRPGAAANRWIEAPPHQLVLGCTPDLGHFVNNPN